MSTADKSSPRPKGLSDVTGAAAVAVLALVAAIIPVLFVPDFVDTFYMPKLTLLTAGVIIAATLLVAGVVLGQRLPKGYLPLDMAVGAFLVIAIISTVAAASPAYSVLGKYGRPEGLMALLTYAGLYFVVSRIRWTTSRIRTLSAAVAVGAVVASLWAIIEVMGVKLVPWAPPPFAAGRASGTLGNPTLLAAYLAVAFFVVIGLIASVRSAWARLVAATAVLPIGAALWLSFGRTGIIALIVGLVVAGATYLLQRKGTEPVISLLRASAPVFIVTALFVVVGIAAAIAVSSKQSAKSPQAKAAVTRAADLTSTQDRIFIWKSAASMIMSRPHIGYGPDSFQLVFPRYQTLESARVESSGLNFGRAAEDAHNIFIQYAATLGIPGLLAFCAILFLTVRTFLFKAVNEDLKPLTPILMGGTLAFVVAAAFTPVVSAFAMFLWIFAGLSVASRREVPRAIPATTDKTPSDQSGASMTRMLALVGLLPAAGLLLLVAMMPLGAEAQFSKGEKLWALGKLTAATGHYETAIRINPLRDKYMGTFGQRLVDRGNFSKKPETIAEGADHLTLALERNPSESSYPLALGIANMKLEKVDNQAMSRSKYYLGEAVRLAPRDPRALYYLGEIGLMTAQGEEDALAAGRSLRAAVNISPDLFEAHKSLGLLYQLLGKRKDAIASLTTANRLKKGDPQVEGALKELAGKGDAKASTGKHTAPTVAPAPAPAPAPIPEAIPSGSGSHSSGDYVPPGH